MYMHMLFWFGCAAPADTISTVGDCVPESEVKSAPDVPHQKISRTSPETLVDTGLLATPYAVVITSTDELRAFEADYGDSFQGVDFSSEQVLAAFTYAAATCGLQQKARVVELDGAPHLRFDVTDTSGTCDLTCDMLEGRSVAVKVARTDVPATACLRVKETCE
jgi:hypothetical protein